MQQEIEHFNGALQKCFILQIFERRMCGAEKLNVGERVVHLLPIQVCPSYQVLLILLRKGIDLVKFIQLPVITKFCGAEVLCLNLHFVVDS